MNKTLDQNDHPLARYARRIGYSFNIWVRMVSFIFALFALFSLFNRPLLGIPVVLILLFVGLSHYGVQVEFNRNRFREYSGFLGLKWGRWMDLSHYPDVAILKENEGYALHSMSNRTTVHTTTQFGVYFLTSSHYKKILIQKFDSLEEAKSFTTEVAQVLGRNPSEYRPKRSSRRR